MRFLFDYLSHIAPQAPAWALDAWSRLLECALTHLLRCTVSSSASTPSSSSSELSASFASASIAESAFLDACARGLPRVGERTQRVLLRQWSTKSQPPQPQPSIHADDDGESSIDRLAKNVSLPSLRRQCPTAFVCAALALHLHASASSADDADDDTNDRDDDDDDEDGDDNSSSNVKPKPKTGAKSQSDADAAVCDAALAAALSLLRAQNERQAALLAHEMAAGTWWSGCSLSSSAP